MSRRYYFTFSTLKKMTCTVNMYDEETTGDDVELSISNPSAPGYPADDPVRIEEDHSNNILSFVRSKTGYISLIEATNGSLDVLYPKYNSQIKVEITYGNRLIFAGFLKSQAFQADYIEYHRTVQLPIMSYLEYLRDEPMNAGVFENTGTTSLADILESHFQLYSAVVLPYFKVVNPYTDEYSHALRLDFYNRAIAPYNHDYGFGVAWDGVEPDVYSPITYGEFLEGLCSLLGFMVHDVEDKLVFTQFGHDDDYIEVERENFASPEGNTSVVGSGSDETTVESIFSLFSEKNKRSTANSLNNITLEYEDTNYPQAIDLKMSRRKANYGGITLLEFMGRGLASSYITTVTPLADDTVCVAGDGDDEFLRVTNFRITSNPMFTLNFDVMPVYHFYYPNKVQFKADGYAGTFRIAVISDGMYYDPEGEGDPWKSYPVYREFTPSEDEGLVSFTVETRGSSISVLVYATELIRQCNIKDIELLRVSDADNQEVYYMSSNAGRKIIWGDKNSRTQCTIQHRFFYHHFLSPTIATKYNMATQAMPELKLIMRPVGTNVPDMLQMYIEQMAIFNERGGVWRLISYDVSPANDEFTLYFMNATY